MTTEAAVHVAQQEGLLRLSSGPLTLVLSPALGGCIARFDYGAKDRIYPVVRGAEGVPTKILSTGNLPLVPFVNRVRGTFSFRGRQVRLSPNLAGDPSPLHGQAWLGAWDVAQQSETSAELVYRHEPGEWPWAYEARQLFELSEDALDLTLSCRNLSDEPMPCGLGHHPYFTCDAGTRLTANVTHAWTIDENTLPLDRVPAEGQFDLNNRSICAQGLDHGFEGWDGTARIDNEGWPFAIEISAPGARFFHVYSPAEGGTFAAEPVGHRTAALNEPEEEWEALGMKVLEPGESTELKMRIKLVAA